ncbi:IQ calmodulin-binding motif-containing protein 1-like isoform X2 [Dunckerocampus dactyliophorus]|uniref:IQ calmodulin-binding motif-containing protein 1-like isoform X2 n=1 Tax=Dunckerocampus dactyliophorus TaxID=161453 RepID=UPI002405D158|nr:IQ calmodulin-binding motif-containing protein 1-like isoform X2 [Dunckerocampus dactyliophorus]
MEQYEGAVMQLKRQVEDERMTCDETVNLLNNALNRFVNMAAVQKDSSVLSRVKSVLYQSGVLHHCITLLTLDPPSLRGNWSAAATLASLTSSCCVGVEPSGLSETFHRLFLPSVMDSLLLLASQLARRTQKVMDSVSRILRTHAQLTMHILSSAHYEFIQGSDATTALLCVQMWIDTCIASSDYLSKLCDDSILLLLNEAVGQLTVTSDTAVGGASVRLILQMSNQLPLQTSRLLLQFKGLDSLLDKDWRGRGFDQEVHQLITLIQSCANTSSVECVRAACVIQAAWRAYLTRRRLKTLNSVVSMLQRRFRARKEQQQQQRAAQQWEEELNFQVCIQRQQARTKFHQKQRQLLQLLPPDQVQSYLQECERRAAVLIQSAWRGFLIRRHLDFQRRTLRHMQTQQHAARTLQKAVRHFLQKRCAADVLVSRCCWIGQKGLTDSQRAVWKTQVEEYVRLHPSMGVSREQCEHLHVDVQRRLQVLKQQMMQRMREHQKIESLLAHTHNQLDLLKESLPLSDVKMTDFERFLSPCGTMATQARDAHNARLQDHKLPWWRTLDGMTAGL